MTRLRLIATVAHIYRTRVREQPLQELLALFGIAAGVALLFAVQVSSSSVVGAVERLSKGVTGSATLEIAARGTEGIEQSVARRAQALESVRVAAPVVEQRIIVKGPRDEQPLTLLGVDERLSGLDAPLLRELQAESNELRSIGFYVTTATASRIGARPGDRIRVVAGAKVTSVVLAGMLGHDKVGELVGNPVAVAPLGSAQRIAGMGTRINRVLIVPADESRAREELVPIAGEGADVRASTTEVDLIAAAMRPDQISGALFSLVAVVIGLLFAFNAMLLAIVQRQRQMSIVRVIGADRATLVAIVVFDALVLGLAASLAGIVLGDQLSRVAFREVPQYLASGFPIGTQRIVGTGVIAVSLAGGIVVSAAASAKPAIEMVRSRSYPGAVETEDAADPGRGGFRIGTLTAIAAIAVGFAVALACPRLTPLGIFAALGAMALVIRPMIGFMTKHFRQTTRSRGAASWSLASDELSASISRVSVIALIAAAATLAIVSVGGAKLDLERGIETLTGDYFRAGDLWVAPSGEGNVFVTRKFEPGDLFDRVGAVPGVASVARCSWTYLDVNDRRVLVISPSAESPMTLVPNQVIKGDLRQAANRIRQGGWVALSTGLSEALGSRIGQVVKLPTPSGTVRLRLAAVTGNHGWPSGSLVIGERDYASLWKTGTVTAASVMIEPGADAEAVKSAVVDAAGSRESLAVLTGEEMVSVRSAAFAQGLTRLNQITLLIIGASVLAVTAAVFSGIWQRRRRLNSLRAIGVYKGELRLMLLMETLAVVLAGCLVGAVFGLVGQFFASRWLTPITGYMTDYEVALGYGAFTTVRIVALSALAAIVPAVVVTRAASAGKAGS